MSVRHFGLLVFLAALTASAGCSRKTAGQPAPPPTKPTEEPPKPAPKPPEPGPDEPVKLQLPPKPPPTPEKTEPEPWIVGQAPEPTPFTPIVFPNLGPQAVTGLAVRPELNRAVVTIRVDKKGQPLSTRIALCDTAEGKILTEWVLPGEFGALDLSPNGRSIIATAPNPGKGRDTLRMWLVSTDGQLKRWTWTPHTEPDTGPPRTPSGRQMTSAESVEVRWAAFVGNDRIVSASKGGQIRVYDTDGPKAICTIDATLCRPAITPDGTRVAFLAGEEVALLDPIAGRVVSTRQLGPPPPYPVLAFSPDGTRLAVGGNGKALLMDMTTAVVRHTVLPRLRVTENGIYDKSFGWAGERYFYSDQQLHDPNFPLPIWEYRGAEQGQFRGWQLWLSVKNPTTGTSTIRPFTLPHLDAQLQINTAKIRPGMFALKPGSGIRLDITGLPVERRDEVKTALEARLKEIGYALDPTSTAVLFASVEPVGTKTSMAYLRLGSFPYMRRPAKLRLVLNGKELWSEEWANTPPFMLFIPQNKSGAEAFADHNPGDPNYKLFTTAPLPSYFPGPNAPTGAFGSSEFQPGGIKDNVGK